MFVYIFSDFSLVIMMRNICIYCSMALREAKKLAEEKKRERLEEKRAR